MKYSFLFIIALGLLLQACGGQKTDTTPKEQPKDSTEMTTTGIDKWVKNAVIYEVNLRQYTPEGTIAAFEKHLDQIKDLGVDILWFMPIHPIGVKNRKETEASLGSYYSIRDYRGVNPDFGTAGEFKALVGKCHDMGMKVVLDWVGNHTAWDHVWVTEHPEWYTADSTGKRPIVPVDNDGKPTDWTDVADLDFNNPALRQAMINDMKYWVTDFDVDGFRCDVAGFVPLDFWVTARKELEQVKPLFMLAEWEDASYYQAFDFTYGWHQHHVMQEIAQGKQSAKDWAQLAEEAKCGWTGDPNDIEVWGPYNNQMNFITNHDENSWNKTAFDRFGPAYTCFAKLSFTVPGLPLIYSGQEAAMNKVLRFFEKDTIDWSEDSLRTFYKELVELKHKNPALWIGEEGGDFELVPTNSDQVFAFRRTAEANKILVLANLSNSQSEFSIASPSNAYGTYSFDTPKKPGFVVIQEAPIALRPWECQILIEKVVP